ncbi:MAG: cytochrome P450 [Thermoanaerobaculia bacterium]
MARARAEVDDVLGADATPHFEHLAQLPYLEQILKETLRLCPPSPSWGRRPFEDTVIGGKYFVERHQPLAILTPMLHRDPKVWGDDPERFDPDRFSPAAVAQLPANAWKPFGTGQRACIGSAFALQEAHLFLASALQRFDLTAHDPSYQLRIRETLTFKPEGFYIRARRRNASSFRPRARTAPPPGTTAHAFSPPPPPAPAESVRESTPLLVLYGSNSGSAEAFAQRIVADAGSHGYAAEIGVLDDHVGRLPTTGAVLVVTASYEGQPTDNARNFVAWLDGLGPEALRGVKFGVFGCGNRDWVRTYQAIPKRIDAKLEAAGAARVVDRGEADARGDFFGDFDRWSETLWGALGGSFGVTAPAASGGPKLELEVVQETPRRPPSPVELTPGVIVENRELVDLGSPIGRSKRHIEIALPEGMTYRAGDYRIGAAHQSPGDGRSRLEPLRIRSRPPRRAPRHPRRRSVAPHRSRSRSTSSSRRTSSSDNLRRRNRWSSWRTRRLARPRSGRSNGSSSRRSTRKFCRSG